MEVVMATAPIAIPAVRLKNILFPTDFSDSSRHALPHVTHLARRFGATLHLCHITTPSELVLGAPEAAPELYELEHRTCEKALEEMRFSPEMRGLNVNTILTGGILKEEMEKAIAENQIDLIILSTRGRTGIRRLVIGSVADVVCRTATCPVLTIGPDVRAGENLPFRRILVPTDFSEHSISVLPHVLHFASEYQAAITFLHVIPADEGVNVNARLLAADARRTLKRVFSKECGEHQPQFLIEFGHPAEAIVRAAAETKADLIAMGIRPALIPEVHFRAGIAYQVMVEAPCPVLTCR
jgi:nucleotide-binding universal stress UspA family protein